MNIKQIQHAITHAKQLHIIGSAKDQTSSSSPPFLDMSLYSGIIEYRPDELVMSVKAGTTVKTIKQTLAKQHQSLPFESIESMSIGAAYAKGSSQLSDAVLGIKIIDGQGRILSFGGKVMKNVAGYDVSRLLVGSKGMLAVICEISFRVLPNAYINHSYQSPLLESPSSNALKEKIELGLKTVFDPNHVFI